MEKKARTNSQIDKMCGECLESCFELCEQKEDTKPKDCQLLRHYLSIARKEASPEYDVCLAFTDLDYIFYIAKDGIVIAQHEHYKPLIGEILLRKQNPEWF